MTIWIILGIVLFVGIAVLAIYLMRDDVSRKWRKKINVVLKEWSQTDEYLQGQSEHWLRIMRRCTEELLAYPESLAYDTAEKVKQLRSRIIDTLKKQDT